MLHKEEKVERRAELEEIRIEGQDTVQDVVIKLSEGNPGALRVCMDIIEKGGSIDPDVFMEGAGLLLLLDSLSLYGSKIWMLYKDVCGENLVNTVAMLRAWQLGYISEEKLKHAVDNHGNGIEVDAVYKQVKEQLPKFASATKPLVIVIEE